MSLVFLENDIPLALLHLMLGCSFSLQVSFGAAWKKNSSRPCTLLLDVIRPCVHPVLFFAWLVQKLILVVGRARQHGTDLCDFSRLI